MRTIKFRGKSIFNGKWIYGGLRIFCDGSYTIHNEWSGAKKGEFDGKDYPVIDETVGQYIGLKDSKGKEIYAGDLMQDPPSGYAPRNILEVFWDDELSGFQLRSTDKDHLYQTPLNEKMKIIGNIYSNPELLTKNTKKGV